MSGCHTDGVRCLLNVHARGVRFRLMGTGLCSVMGGQQLAVFTKRFVCYTLKGEGGVLCFMR